MHLLIDENIPFADAFFGSLARLERLPGAAITPAALNQVDGLLVRSVTPVNAALLQDSALRFIGTATIGVDHIDQAALEAAGIAFASAPGCNADAVGDYVLASLLRLAAEQGFCLKEQVIGILGVGQVGGRLAQRLQAYGCRLLLNDPPRQKAEGASGFVDLETLLQGADIVCLHTPLTHSGPFPSAGLLGEPQLRQLAGKVLLNAGRGGVIQQGALKKLLREGVPLTLLLDVFADEPALDTELISQITQATPHIAGYSLEGKARGTEQLYQAFCAFFGYTPEQSLDILLPPPPVSQMTLNPGWSAEEACRRAALLVYDPREDAARLSRALEKQEPTAAYQQLRKNYPLRREFSSLQIHPANRAQAEALQALGFSLGSR